MRRPTLAAALALAALSGCTAGLSDGLECSAEPTAGPCHARDGEPPAPLPEVRSAAPAPGMVWVAGAWHWNGVRYVWIPGRWESPPPAP